MRKRYLLATSFIILFILGSIPVIAETETETGTHSSYQTSQGYQTSQQHHDQTPALYFTIVHVAVPSDPTYTGGSGSASIFAQGTTLTIHIHVQGAASGAHFTLLLSVNNSTQPVANMTTDDEGELEAEAQANLAPGNYSLGLEIRDGSSFETPTLVMASNPSSQPLALPLTSQTTYSESETEGQQVNTLGGGESDDGEVRNAIQSMVIPAVINVGPSGSSAVVLDTRFSISVGTLQNNGIIVSVSAANVTGPRVLLVNLTAPVAQKLFSGSLLITLDNSTIQQASSVSEVIGARPGDPAKFVIYSASSGLKLLISIPHFSFHTIDIIPILTEIGAIVLDLTTTILTVGAATVLIFLAYGRRTRFVR